MCAIGSRRVHVVGRCPSLKYESKKWVMLFYFNEGGGCRLEKNDAEPLLSVHQTLETDETIRSFMTNIDGKLEIFWKLWFISDTILTLRWRQT